MSQRNKLPYEKPELTNITDSITLHFSTGRPQPANTTLRGVFHPQAEGTVL